jgi:ribosomal protein S18
MPRKTHPEKPAGRAARGKGGTAEIRTPRPKPKIDFTFDALDYKNVALLKQFVTDQGASCRANTPACRPTTSASSTARSNARARCS